MRGKAKRVRIREESSNLWCIALGEEIHGV